MIKGGHEAEACHVGLAPPSGIDRAVSVRLTRDPTDPLNDFLAAPLGRTLTDDSEKPLTGGLVNAR